MSGFIYKFKNYLSMLWYLIFFMSIYFIFKEMELDKFIFHFNIKNFFLIFILFCTGKFVLTEYSYQMFSVSNNSMSRYFIYKKVFFFDSFKYFPFISGLDMASSYLDFKNNNLNANLILFEKTMLYMSPLIFILLLKYPILNIFLLVFFFFKKKFMMFLLLFTWFVMFGLIHSLYFNIFDMNIFVNSNLASFMGYISFFAPAGIGTSEAIIYTKYSDTIDIQSLMMILTNISIINVVVDLSFSLISSIFFKLKWTYLYLKLLSKIWWLIMIIPSYPIFGFHLILIFIDT